MVPNEQQDQHPSELPAILTVIGIIASIACVTAFVLYRRPSPSSDTLSLQKNTFDSKQEYIIYNESYSRRSCSRSRSSSRSNSQTSPPPMHSLVDIPLPPVQQVVYKNSLLSDALSPDQRSPRLSLRMRPNEKPATLPPSPKPVVRVTRSRASSSSSRTEQH